MRTPLLPAALALLGPTLVFATAGGSLVRVQTAEDAREAKNAGRVLNGAVLDDGDVVGAMAEALASDPRVVVLGNSLSNTDVDAVALAQALGLPRGDVLKLSVPNSMAAHWYAILKNRVYAQGHRPELVLIVSDLQSLLALAPRSEASHLNLQVQLGEDEAVIDERLGSRWWLVERARQARGLLRDRWMGALRDTLADQLWWGAPGNRGRTRAALDRVFADDRVDATLHHRVVPVWSTAKFEVAFDPDDLAHPDQSFLPELLNLARDHGSRLVLVRPPMSPKLPEALGDVVPEVAERRVGPSISEGGGTWMDLRGMPMPRSSFQNLDHMNPEGGRRFSVTLGELVRHDLGWPEAARPELDLLPARVAGIDRWVPAGPEVTFPHRPPRLPRDKRPPREGRGRAAFFETPSFEFLSDPNVLSHSPHGTRCSPVRVLEDGVVLPIHNVACDEVFREGHGRVCHAPDRLVFSASDGSDPNHNPRTYTLALADDRSCEAGLWSYPHDVARLRAPGDDPVLPRSIGLALDELGRAGAGGVPVVAVRLRDGDRLWFETEVSVAALVGGLELVFPADLPPLEDPVVELDNRSDAFLLWTRVRLGTGEPR